MIQPKLEVTGYRGVWGDTLTAEIAVHYARGFAQFIKSNTNKENPTILIGRDGRESGPAIKQAIISALEADGVQMIDGDVLPTPTLIFAIGHHQYDGGIIITASHNPREYNGIKFVTHEARLTNESEVEKIKEFCNGLAPLLTEEGVGGGDHEMQIPDFPREHADHIIKFLDIEKIRARKFKVAVDMINASACVMDPYFFEQLGAELIPLNNSPDGKFAHMPEPTAVNLGDIGALVKSSGADIGFAHDPDADRLVIVNEKGEVISEEYTLGFGAEAILSHHAGESIVINMSTSQMTADIAESHGSKCFRTKVGESNVMAGIMEHHAIMGGEGTSGVIFPLINNCRDGFVSLSLALQLLATRGQTVSECVDSLPKYFMIKGKMPREGDLEPIFEKLKAHFKDAKVNELDGLRLDFPDKSWLHMRASITEPIIRFFGEATSQERIDSLFAEAKSVAF